MQGWESQRAKLEGRLSQMSRSIAKILFGQQASEVRTDEVDRQGQSTQRD